MENYDFPFSAFLIQFQRSVNMSEIITEYRNENTKNIDLLSTIDIIRKINEEDKL